jgi:hypothetical protein
MLSNAAHVNAPSLTAVNSILVISPRSLQAVNSFLGASAQIHLRARNTRTSATISTNPNIHIQPLCQPFIPMLYPFTKPPQGAARED